MHSNYVRYESYIIVMQSASIKSGELIFGVSSSSLPNSPEVLQVVLNCLGRGAKVHTT